jgi:hypothetical protein
MRRNLAAQTSTTVKNFGTTVQQNGGSVNTQSADGRYFLVRLGGVGRIWDSQTDTLYTGNIPPPDAQGYLGISPDGKLAYGGNYPGTNGDAFLSFAINHVTQTVEETGTQFWDLCGAHGVVVSASNGKNYLATFNCSDATQLYAVEMHVDRSSMSVAQQKASALLIFSMVPAFNDSFHAVGVSIGALKDWVFVSNEANDDGFGQTPTTGNWYPFRQEIIAANVLTAEIRRLAHHRSRGNLGSNYYAQPRVSSSPTGEVIVWTSNMNDSTPAGYADLYAIQSPLGAGSGQLPAPQNLRFK